MYILHVLIELLPTVTNYDGLVGFLYSFFFLFFCGKLSLCVCIFTFSAESVRVKTFYLLS